MNKEQILQNFGLTESEAQLYITLLTKGESTASQLAKQTSTNRTFTYDRLKKLEEIGLISYTIKDNKKYFNPAPPNQLLSILKEKEEQIKKILPELEKIQTPKKPGPKIEIFSSKKGIRTALNMVLKEKKEVLIHGSIKKFQEVMGSYYNIWNERRAKEKIQTKILTNDDVEVTNAKVSLLTEETATTTFTFSNKLITISWSDIPVAILIEDKEIVNNNKQFFNNIWNREIKIYTGATGIKKAWLELVEKPSKELVGFGFSWRLAEIYGREFSNKWHKERIKNKIPARLISYNDKNSKKYFDVRMMEWKSFNINFLDENLLGPACTTLSDHLIVTFLYTEKKLKVIVSKNKEMINIYKKHFEILWKKSSKS